MGLQQVLERLAVTFYVITFMSGAHVNYQWRLRGAGAPWVVVLLKLVRCILAGIWGWFMVPLFLFNIWTFIPFAM